MRDCKTIAQSSFGESCACRQTLASLAAAFSEGCCVEALLGKKVLSNPAFSEESPVTLRHSWVNSDSGKGREAFP